MSVNHLVARRDVRSMAGALVIALAALATAPLGAQDVLGEAGVRGAGSTFIYPILSRWSRDYRAFLARGGEFPSADGGLDDPPASSALEYEPVGSLAGTLRVKDRAVDFGASDMPLASAELSQLGLAQFPVVIGGVVVAVNVPGVASGALRLTGPVLADVFLGKVARWSDPAIAGLNPGVKLPNAPIAVVHRSDGSGTTFNFTDYLSKVSTEWKLKVGSELLVRWPTGTGAKGNEGVAQAVKSTPNAIGYVEYAQATQAGLAVAQLQNQAGRFVRPEPKTFQAAAAGAAWSGATDFYAMLTNVAGESAYPITATVFVLMPRNASRTRTGHALDFFDWSLQRGGAAASALGYVPLPASVVQQIKGYWSSTFKLTS